MEIISTIIVAVLSLFGTLVGSYLSNSKTTALLSYRLEQLEKKFAEFTSLEKRVSDIEKQLVKITVGVEELQEEVKKM